MNDETTMYRLSRSLFPKDIFQKLGGHLGINAALAVACLNEYLRC